MEADMNYGPIKRGHRYKILGSGRDFYVVRIKGSVMYAPFWVFNDNGDGFNEEFD